MIKAAVSSSLMLLVPFSVGLADVESDTLHNNTYQEASVSTNCTSIGCALIFPPTQHATTVITNINCSFYVTAGAQVSTALLYTEKAPSRGANVPVYFLGNQGSSYTALGINSQVNYFIKQNDTPVFEVFLYSGTLYGLQCLISGYHS